MGRRSDLDLLRGVLQAAPRHRLSRKRVLESLSWTDEKLKRVIERAQDDDSFRIFVGKGGVIQSHDGERGATSGLYGDVARVIESHWGARQGRMRNAQVLVTASAGKRGQGRWRHPDLVIVADPLRRRSQSDSRLYHAVEVETWKGFSIVSVYQAHAQGFGADFSWVFGNRQPESLSDSWERVLDTARFLGVGVVTFDRPGAFGTYQTHLMAVQRTWRSAAKRTNERKEFRDVALGTRLRDSIEL